MSPRGTKRAFSEDQPEPLVVVPEPVPLSETLSTLVQMVTDNLPGERNNPRTLTRPSKKTYPKVTKDRRIHNTTWEPAPLPPKQIPLVKKYRGRGPFVRDTAAPIPFEIVKNNKRKFDPAFQHPIFNANMRKFLPPPKKFKPLPDLPQRYDPDDLGQSQAMIEALLVQRQRNKLLRDIEKMGPRDFTPFKDTQWNWENRRRFPFHYNEFVDNQSWVLRKHDTLGPQRSHPGWRFFNEQVHKMRNRFKWDSKKRFQKAINDDKPLKRSHFYLDKKRRTNVLPLFPDQYK